LQHIDLTKESVNTSTENPRVGGMTNCEAVNNERVSANPVRWQIALRLFGFFRPWSPSPLFYMYFHWRVDSLDVLGQLLLVSIDGTSTYSDPFDLTASLVRASLARLHRRRSL